LNNADQFLTGKISLQNHWTQVGNSWRMDFLKKRKTVLKDFCWHYAILRAWDYIFGGIVCQNFLWSKLYGS